MPRARVRAIVTTGLEVAGIGAITAGSAAIYHPLGLIVGGLGLILVGWRLA